MANSRDRQILNSIINPLLPIGEGVHDLEQECFASNLEDEVTDRKETRISKQFEKEGIDAAEKGNIEEAIVLFGQAISAAPERPSCYNNRAQAYRLKGEIQSALNDLNMAIRQYHENINSHNNSGKQAAKQAHCQRGLILRRNGREQEAMSDFKSAAELGSGWAKSVLVELNPYAAMCNKMLKDVFSKLEEGIEA